MFNLKAFNLNPCLFLLALLGCLALSPSARAADVHFVASAVDRHYNQLRSLQCEFTETYTGLGMDRTESGTLWLKKPGKMRWQYRSPSGKLFVSDGKDAWFYVPGEQQVRKTDVKKLDDLRSPLAFLLGKTRLELHDLSFAPDRHPVTPGDVMLRGVPQTMPDRENQVLLEITPENAISRISIEAADGSTTEYRLSGQKEDVPLADSLFRFSVPPGVEVVEGSFGQ
jgi:outer membrane lipoprotein carrier protein